MLICANLSVFVLNNFLSIKAFGRIENDISVMKKKDDLKLRTTLPELFGYYYTLRDNGVKFQRINTEENSNLKSMYEWKIQVLNK